MKTFKVETEVSRKDIYWLLVTAFEGGVGYWAGIKRYVRPAEVVDVGDEHPQKYGAFPLSPGGAIILSDVEGEDNEEWALDLAAIERGLKVMAAMYPEHWVNFRNENADAETGDVFVQCCLFGRLVYG